MQSASVCICSWIFEISHIQFISAAPNISISGGVVGGGPDPDFDEGIVTCFGNGGGDTAGDKPHELDVFVDGKSSVNASKSRLV